MKHSYTQIKQKASSFIQKEKNPDGKVRIFKHTDGVNRQSITVREGGVTAEEDDFVNSFSGGFFPPWIQIVFRRERKIWREKS